MSLLCSLSRLSTAGGSAAAAADLDAATKQQLTAMLQGLPYLFPAIQGLGGPSLAHGELQGLPYLFPGIQGLGELSLPHGDLQGQPNIFPGIQGLGGPSLAHSELQGLTISFRAGIRTLIPHCSLNIAW